MERLEQPNDVIALMLSFHIAITNVFVLGGLSRELILLESKQ